jgi:hypothetical protein
MNELPMSRARAERLLVLDGKQHPRGSNGFPKLQIEGGRETRELT